MLVDRIDHGDLEGGDPLPTEELLCRTLHLSRATVHRAYDLLVQENCVDRRPGAGTFVRPRRLRLDPALGTRQQLQLAQAHSDHRCELLGIEKAAPTTIQQDRLGIDSSSPIWRITRLHYLDGCPMIVERSCMACARVPSIDSAEATGLWPRCSTGWDLAPFTPVKCWMRLLSPQPMPRSWMPSLASPPFA